MGKAHSDDCFRIGRKVLLPPEPEQLHKRIRFVKKESSRIQALARILIPSTATVVVAGGGMDFVVYAAGERTLLLIPACLLPPVAAQVAYGPLVVCGRIKEGEGGAKLWHLFAAELEKNSYAAVTVAETVQVLGQDHPFLEQFRMCAPRRKAIQRASLTAP